jgi:hypothetical protein
MVAASLGGDNYVVFSIHSSTCGRRADDFAEIQIKIDSRFGGKKFKIEIDSSIWREECGAKWREASRCVRTGQNMMPMMHSNPCTGSATATSDGDSAT